MQIGGLNSLRKSREVHPNILDRVEI